MLVLRSAPEWHTCGCPNIIQACAGACLEGGGIHEGAAQHSSLGSQALQQHANGHPTREGVGVDQQVWPAGSHQMTRLATASNTGWASVQDTSAMPRLKG